MTRRRIRIAAYAAAGAVGLIAAGLFPGAAASRPSAPMLKPQAPAVDQKLDLSSRTSILRYLEAKGVAPSAVVFQYGPRNYAGPRCPGRAWNCTSAGVVVQIAATAAAQNKFECKPATSANPNPATQTCVVVQGSAGSQARNEARCFEHTSASGAYQSCDITQTNGTGENRAFVDQLIEQKTGSSQAGSQYATVTQKNNTGKNYVLAAQRIDQRTSVVSSGFQSQQGSQTTLVCQGGVSSCTTPGSGSNTAAVYQSLAQKATAVVNGAVSQEQNVGGASLAPSENGGHETFADIAQNSSNGRNTAGLYQQWNQGAEAKSNGSSVHQSQGDFSGGIRGEINQSSHGISEAFAGQNENQQLTAHTPAPGLVSQSQIGPLDCCSTQTDNPSNKFKIDQRSTQRAAVNPPDDDDDDRALATDDNGGGTFQEDTIVTDCDSSGKCTATSIIKQNGVESRIDCSGPSCHEFNSCTNGYCGGGPSSPQSRPSLRLGQLRR